jgi:hypothetical protein
MKKTLNRRSFLRLGALTGIATGLPFRAGAVQAAGSDRVVEEYVTLGRTGLKIADISFGASRLRHGEEDLVRYALDKGVNYFDTAESYTGSASEQVIGNALGSQRNEVYIATKTSVGGSPPASAPAP